MSTVKELFENEELMNNIVEDIEDIPEDAEVFYAVWALGCDTYGHYTNDEVLVGEFLDPDVAVKYADDVTIDLIKEMGFGQPDRDSVYFAIEVETVIADPDNEDGGTINIGTIYSRELWFKEDIKLTTGDYELLDDGTLKVPHELLSNFTVGDNIKVLYADEDAVDILTYNIVHDDGACFHCELTI